MAYFPHAFQKMLIATNQTPFLVGNGTRTTLDLAAGQIGLLDVKTNKLINFNNPANYNTTPQIMLAQGSFHANDTLGASLHGGFQETVKSKGINPKYISKMWVTEPADPANNIIAVCANGCELPCGTTYRLRVDAKGSPALRTLTHNAYLTVDGYTGCCEDDAHPANVDPNVVLLQWADQLNNSPIMQHFVHAEVWNLVVASEAESDEDNIIIVDDAEGMEDVAEGYGIRGNGIPYPAFVGTITSETVSDVTTYTVSIVDADCAAVDVELDPETSVLFFEQIFTDSYEPVTGADVADVHSCLFLSGAYVDTKFGDCSFSPRDHFEIQPLQLYASVVDQTGDPCVDSCFAINEVQEANQGKGYGETLIRELILFKRYLQEPWNDDPRMREVLDDTTLTDLSRNAKYYTYNILHSVPRKSNPSGTMDNDQYLVKIVTPARTTAFETYMLALLVSAGNGGVTLDVY